jgi:hypothetical protein
MLDIEALWRTGLLRFSISTTRLAGSDGAESLSKGDNRPTPVSSLNPLETTLGDFCGSYRITKAPTALDKGKRVFPVTKGHRHQDALFIGKAMHGKVISILRQNNAAIRPNPNIPAEWHAIQPGPIRHSVEAVPVGERRVIRRRVAVETNPPHPAPRKSDRIARVAFIGEVADHYDVVSSPTLVPPVIDQYVIREDRQDVQVCSLQPACC